MFVLVGRTVTVESSNSYTLQKRGGGVALLYTTKALDNLETQNEDQRRGVQIVQNALMV